jgi:hypothetical protein
MPNDYYDPLITGVPATSRYDYDSNGNLIYEGSSASVAGVTQTSTPIWAIQKNTYNANNQIILQQWANGNNNPANVWDNRVALNYY